MFRLLTKTLYNICLFVVYMLFSEGLQQCSQLWNCNPGCFQSQTILSYSINKKQDKVRYVYNYIRCTATLARYLCIYEVVTDTHSMNIYNILYMHNIYEVSYCTLIKKKIKFSSCIRKFRMEQLQSHIWLTASSYSFIGKYLRFSSWIRKPFFIYDFVNAPLWISLSMRKILYSLLSVYTVYIH